VDVLAGSGAALRVDFLNPAGTLIPDPNSVTYTVYATDGTQLVASTPITTGPTDTGVMVNVLAVNNTISGSRQFEKRTVVVNMTSAAHPYTFTTIYRIIPFLNMTVTADDVRSVFGGDLDEVTDDEIDLVAAYFDVAARVLSVNSNATLAAALATGTITEVYANSAIAGMAVINLLPGIQGRLATQRKDGQVSFSRQAINWTHVENQALGMVSRGVAYAAGIPQNAPSYITTSWSYDPVTHWRGHLSWP
jgi:hypothetical protein